MGLMPTSLTIHHTAHFSCRRITDFTSIVPLVVIIGCRNISLGALYDYPVSPTDSFSFQNLDAPTADEWRARSDMHLSIKAGILCYMLSATPLV